MTPPSRRLFFRLSFAGALAAIGVRTKRGVSAQGLGQFTGGPPPCDPNAKTTPAAPQGAQFKTGSPGRVSLREPGMAGTKLVLTGTVSGITCGLIKQALVDFWQADARGAYDVAGYRLRGHQFTDAGGKYRLETIVPGAFGRSAPKLHVRVRPPGTAVFTTQLFFADRSENKSDKDFRPELVMRVADGREGKTATFNIVLDI